MTGPVLVGHGDGGAKDNEQRSVQCELAHWRSAYGGFLLLASAETCLGFAWFSNWFSAPIVFFSHCLIVLAMGVLWHRARRDELRLIPVGFIGVLFTGPLGAAGVLLLAVVLKLKKPQQKLLDDWYGRLSQSTRRDEENLLYRSIISGRAPKSGAVRQPGDATSSITSFHAILGQGSLEEKQSLLGIIALKYHPEFFPLLKIALRDDEPTVRVQAAAVYAKLQMVYKARLKKAVACERGDRRQQQAQILALRDCMRSGFLDEAGLARARAVLEQQEAYYVVSPVT